jgi:hypothetical protein
MASTLISTGKAERSPHLPGESGEVEQGGDSDGGRGPAQGSRGQNGRTVQHSPQTEAQNRHISDCTEHTNVGT